MQKNYETTQDQVNVEEFESTLQENLIKNLKIYHFFRAVLTQKKLANWNSLFCDINISRAL